MLTPEQRKELVDAANGYVAADGFEASFQALKVLGDLVSSWLDQAVAGETERCAAAIDDQADFYSLRGSNSRALRSVAAELRAGKP